MKYLIAVIKPFKLDAVRESLTKLGIIGMTATDVKGFGRQKGQTEIYRGAEYLVTFLPKMQLEIALDDHLVDAAIDAIQQSAQSGHIGDGKIFVLDVDQAVRIRTNERGSEAL